MTPPSTASTSRFLATIWPTALAVAPSVTKTVEKPSTNASADFNTRLPVALIVVEAA